MCTYREQEAAGNVDTPGGLEHMGDVWRLLRRWDTELAKSAPQPQSDERRNALESLLPGRATNAAQTDWGKGYIEGWMARGKSQTRPRVKGTKHG